MKTLLKRITNSLITILARKNSKGLPNKHLLLFNGKPLIQWTIEQAKDYAAFNDADIPSPRTNLVSVGSIIPSSHILAVL